MTELEAKEILDDLFVAFPQTRAWLTACDDPKATHAIWIKVVERCDLRDARTVVDDLVMGDLPMPEAYNRDQTAQIFRRHCRDRATLRIEAARTKGYQQMARRESDLDRREHARAYYAMHWLLDNGGRPSSEVEEVIAWSHGSALPKFMEDAIEPRKLEAVDRKLDIVPLDS